MRLSFKVSARTVAKSMRLPHDRGPSPGWRCFLERHAAEIWACDFFCVQTLWFKTLYVFFVVSHAGREVLHAQVTEHPTAEWVAQQIVECCGWDREPPRFLIRDRDSRYGSLFEPADTTPWNLADSRAIQSPTGQCDRRAVGEIDPAGMFGSHLCLR